MKQTYSNDWEKNPIKWFDITLFRHFAFDNVILILLFFIKAWNSILFVSIKYVYTVYVYIYIYQITCTIYLKQMLFAIKLKHMIAIKVIY